MHRNEAAKAAQSNPRMPMRASNHEVNRKSDNRSAMTFQNFIRLLTASRPDCYSRISARGRHATISCRKMTAFTASE